MVKSRLIKSRFLLIVFILHLISIWYFTGVFAGKEHYKKDSGTQNVNRIIVKYKEGKNKKMLAGPFEGQKRKHNLKLKKKIKRSQMEVYEIDEQTDINDVLKDLEKNSEIEYAEPDYKLKKSDFIEDSRAAEQWGIHNTGQFIGAHYGTPGIDINLSTVWGSTYAVNNIIVAIIDTGIDIMHPDLKDNIFVNKNEIPGNGIDDDGNGYTDDVNGWDYVYGDNTLYDSIFEDLHATHVAGIIAAGKNSEGVCGVAPNARILPLKFLGGDDGSGYTSDAIEAIKYAKAMGVRVVNCSWGNSEYSKALEDEMKNSGMLFVCSAGNEGADLNVSPIYPACFDIPNILTVGAINNRGDLAGYSSYGSKVSVAAPGSFILSTYPEETYGYLSGTSMAAPFVTGLAALILSCTNSINNTEVVDCIKANVTKLDSLNGKVGTGGIINVEETLKNINGLAMHTPTSTTTSTPTYTPTNTNTPTSTPTNTPISPKVIEIDAGTSHTVALKDDGTISAWGYNENGQCDIPENLEKVKSIYAGGSETFVVKEDGSVLSWGFNGDEIGDDSGVKMPGKLNIPDGVGRIKALEIGWLCNAALKEDGNLIVWGFNRYGQCDVPQGLTNIKEVSIGGFHVLVLKEDGTVAAWGDNSMGQCNVPEGLTNVKAVSAGLCHNIALKEDGTVVAWGENVRGECDIPEWLGKAKAISAGNGFSVAVRENGTVCAWGINKDEQCNVPENLTGVKMVATGEAFTIALKEDGKIVAWGDNYVGQLTIPDEIVYQTPTCTPLPTSTSTPTPTKKVSVTPPPSIISFGSSKFEKYIRYMIEKPYGFITEKDVENITYVEFTDKTLQDLNGIQYLDNLILLNLFKNSIVDTSFLNGLSNLKGLILSNNNINNLDCVGNLKNLVCLRAGMNKISNLDPLFNLSKIKELYLFDNSISNIASLANLRDSLKVLSLWGNDIGNVNVLNGFSSLTELDLSFNMLNYFNYSARIDNLSILDISHNELTDITDLSGFKELKYADLSYNNITNIAPLSSLNKLKTLDLSYNRIVDINPLSGLNKLKALYLANNQITDYSPVGGYYNNLTDKDFTLNKPEPSTLVLPYYPPVVGQLDPPAGTAASTPNSTPTYTATCTSTPTAISTPYAVTTCSPAPTPLAPPANYTHYKDISGHWAEEYIDKMIRKNIINGYSDGTVRPDSYITRAEVVIILVKAVGLEPVLNQELNFKDKNDIPLWAKGYIKTAVDNRIVAGYNDNTFRASNRLSRKEIAVMAMKAFGFGESGKNLGLKDYETIPVWAVNYINKAFEMGIIKGYSDNTFRPDKNITRAEVFTIIGKCMESK